MKKEIVFGVCLFFLFSSSQKNFAQSQSKIDSLLNVLKTSKEDTNKVYTLNNLSRVYWTNSPDTSLRFARQAMELAKKIYFKKGIGIAYLNVAVYLRNTGNYEAAIQVLDSAKRIAIAINNNKLLGDCYNSIANIYWYQSNYEKALEFYLNSVKVKEQLKDTLGIALVNGNVGMIYTIQGNYPLALQYYFKSLKALEAKGDKQGIAGSLNNIGLIYYNEGNYSEALDYYFKSLAISEPINAIKHMGESYANIGLIYMKQGKYSLARDNYFKTLQIAETTGDKASIGVCYDNFGIIYKEEGNYAEALKNHFASLKIAQEIGDTLGISGCYSNIGNVYNKQENYFEAEQYLLKGLRLAQEIGVKLSVKDNYEALSDVYEKAHDYKNSIKFHKLYAQIKDTLLNEANNKQINEMKAKYEAEKKDKEITGLTKDKEIQRLEIKKQTLLKNTLIGGLVLLLLLSFFIYNTIRTRQKLKLQTLRNKIASDLHDDVGSTLSSISIFSEMAKAQSSEVTPMLDQIGESSRKMLDAMADIVWTINPENDQFEKIILRMKSFAFELLGAKKIDFEFNADDSVSKLKLPMDVRKNLFLIFKEATNNMVKYSEADKASFAISGNKDKLTMLIRDNGKGFDLTQESQGNGLKNMKKRAIEIGANLLIESEHQMGTTVQLVLNLA